MGIVVLYINQLILVEPMFPFHLNLLCSTVSIGGLLDDLIRKEVLIL